MIRYQAQVENKGHLSFCLCHLLLCYLPVCYWKCFQNLFELRTSQRFISYFHNSNQSAFLSVSFIPSPSSCFCFLLSLFLNFLFQKSTQISNPNTLNKQICLFVAFPPSPASMFTSITCLYHHHHHYNRHHCHYKYSIGTKNIHLYHVTISETQKGRFIKKRNRYKKKSFSSVACLSSITKPCMARTPLHTYAGA